MFEDLLSNPEKYDEQMAQLIQQLISGQKKLDELKRSELQLLDRATFEYSQAHIKKPESLVQKPVAPPQEASYGEPTEEEQVYGDAGPIEQELVVPEQQMPTHWWKR